MNENIVVVLQNGSPIEVLWIDKVKVFFETYFRDEAEPEATVRINPSGHLSETFPIKVEDNPSYSNFVQKNKMNVEYKEGIFIGYRHYDTHNIDILFPFGHCLSYTTFEYSNIRLKYDGDVITKRRRKW